MTGTFLLEQALNGLQYGLMLFLLAAGLTIVFGVMDMINLAHGSLYMAGAFLAAWLAPLLGSFWLALGGAVVLTAAGAMVLERTLLRSLYRRDHLSQVLATFALILILNDAVRMVFGNDRPLSAPAGLDGPVALPFGLHYPAWRLVIIGVGLALAAALYVLVQKTRVGAWVRAGASDRDMSTAMGVNVPSLFTAVFGLGAALCAVAGALLAPLLAVQVGMGENILIPAFVVVVIGGIGSIRGALVGALLVGVVDTLGRTLLQQVLREGLPPQWASAAGPALASVAVYVLMAAVLVWRPQGLLPVRGR
ncbi:branched-chain amino acid ABC transporter permease [Ramlibacter henchirensis]|uniref:Branched-chain amino acid ABC transporter permease n=1 Tax=Ramlibacter henchirensis TaxID=204072 RepID=A0A4Z0BXL0_9BURK|nr:branched-chain amino acid ABC transporter permease [Ramlibacter henchirensis]TFZ02745.1 branched-chain amino acid ABC transporter permease [Ramlibacter henchirensis]